jgi:hypothetical protein
LVTQQLHIYYIYIYILPNFNQNIFVLEALKHVNNKVTAENIWTVHCQKLICVVTIHRQCRQHKNIDIKGPINHCLFKDCLLLNICFSHSCGNNPSLILCKCSQMILYLFSSYYRENLLLHTLFIISYSEVPSAAQRGS